jgi:hypothetical protein
LEQIFGLELVFLKKQYLLGSWHRISVAETREHMGNPEETERLPMEADIRRMVKTAN